MVIYTTPILLEICFRKWYINTINLYLGATMGYSEKVLDENKTPTQVHINCSLSVPFEEIEKCKQWATKVGYDYQNITDLLFTAYYNGLFMPDYRELELCHYSYEED